MTNAFSEAAWAIVKNAIVKQRTADNVVVSPCGFSCLFIMVGRHLSEPDYLCRLLKMNKNWVGPALWESVSGPPLEVKEEAIKRKRDGTTQGLLIKGLIDKEFHLQPNFRGLARMCFKATLDQVDFQFGDHHAMVAGVNSWVNKNTNRLLSKIVDNDDVIVDSLSRLLFVSTQYFKGAWLNPFNPDLTAMGDFRLMDGDTIRVPFMTGCEHYYHNKVDNFDLIRIPYYRNGAVSLYIFLPNESGTQEFQQFLHEIGSENFRVEDFKLKRPSDRDLLIPKFNLQYYTADFPEMFSSVVKTSICNAPFKADKIFNTDDEDLFLGKILQNSVIKVAEGGTEAASATSLSICGASPNASTPSPTSPMPPLPPIVVDRPFIFMIRGEEQKLTLFLGAVTNPLT